MAVGVSEGRCWTMACVAHDPFGRPSPLYVEMEQWHMPQNGLMGASSAHVQTRPCLCWSVEKRRERPTSAVLQSAEGQKGMHVLCGTVPQHCRGLTRL